MQAAFELLADVDPYFIGVPKDVVDDAAIAGCALWTSGGTFEDYVYLALDNGVPAESAGYLAAYAFTVFCPEHSDIAG